MKQYRPITSEEEARGYNWRGQWEKPAMPTADVVDHVQQQARKARRCRSCGLSSMDGAMFTTLPSSGCCDDCV